MDTKPQKYTIAVTRIDLLRKTIARLREAGIPDPAESAIWLASEAFGCTRSELWSDSDANVDAAGLKRFEKMVARRATREPVQYIVGHTEFYGIRLAVDPRVLIPRPETELLVEKAIALARNEGLSRILDVGTGSGCIAIALAIHLGKSGVTACDVSSKALAVARANANSNDVEIDFRLADVLDLDFTQRFRGPFDLVISNPPYIPAEDRASIMPEVRDFEPEVALFVSGDPVVYYRAIARHATDLLNARGRIVLEIHEDHAGPVMQTLEQAGLREVELHTDFAGRPRIVTTRV